MSALFSPRHPCSGKLSKEGVFLLSLNTSLIPADLTDYASKRESASGTSSGYKNQSSTYSKIASQIHFYISHYAGLRRPVQPVSSVYIHDSTTGQQVVREGQTGWVFQAVISNAAFRSVPRIGKPCFTVMSLHFNNNYAKKNVICAVRTAMYQEQFDMVAGNLNGAAWRRKCSEDQRRDSTIEEAFANTNLPIPQGPPALWGPGGVHGEWCGFIKPPGTENEWHVSSV